MLLHPLTLPLLVVLAIFISISDVARAVSKERLNEYLKKKDEAEGKRWAVLVAGSNLFFNYRHQADICHAYQILKKGGLKDENIIVFMYDDIAYNKENPFKGKIFNRPNGSDVYEGVVKDYTGEHVTALNFYAVLEGNRSAISGGSGKVLDTGPNDHIFIYYSDHGGPGTLGMPDYKYVYADKLNAVLRSMHERKRYKSLLFYLEACESGSMFHGFETGDLDLYALTAANEEEYSYATYCPTGSYKPNEVDTCLGDLFSVAWMEDTEKHNRNQETLDEQYKTIKKRVAAGAEV